MRLEDAKCKARQILQAKCFLVLDAKSAYGTLFHLVAEGRNGVRHIRLKASDVEPCPGFREDMRSLKHLFPFSTDSTVEVWEFCGKEGKLKIEYI